MKRNMRKWLEDMVASKTKKALPILSFPSIQLMNIGVKELIADSTLQAKGMKLIADRLDSAAAVSMMDLSVEAEAFGAEIRFSDDEVPTVVGHIVENLDEANALCVPEVGAKRTGLYIDAIRQACELITDRPVLAGVIGPFSLAGRLLDVSEAFIYCYDDPDLVHAVLDKATQFLIQYISAYKEAGANGVMIAEPLAGLLSPDLNDEFSVHYMRRIVEAVQTEDFAVIYHNCGNGVIRLIDGILTIGAAGYHFGNAIDMAEMLPHILGNIPVMGNIDPAGQFRNGTVDSIKAETTALLEKCGSYSNFIISSGCDIPPLTPWENIDAFFEAVKEFYQG